MFYVYIVRCADETLYTGYAANIEERLRKHNKEVSGGAKYTSARGPVKLVYKEPFRSKSKALKREALIKSYTRKEKEILIGSAED